MFWQQSFILTNSDQTKKKQEKKTTKGCQLLPSLKRTICFLRTPKIPSLQPENTHLGPPRLVGSPAPSSYPSRRRLFPRAAVPVGIAPGGETWVYQVETVVFQQLKGNGKMEFVWQKTKTNNTFPLPIERGWSPYLQVLQLFFWLAGKKWGEHGSVP